MSGKKKLKARIRALENSHATLSRMDQQRRQELDKLGLKLERAEVMIKGLWPAVADLLAGKGVGGTLTSKREVDYQEFSSLSGAVGRIAGREEFTVTYESPQGRTWVNGRLTS